MGNQGKIGEAIAEAMSELHDVQRRLEQLRRLEHRAQQLETFISAGRIVLGEATESETQTPPTPNSPPHSTLPHRGAAKRGNRTVGDCVKILLEERQRPMPLLEMTQELLARKWVKGKWAREVIRNAVNRGDEFERIIPGVYALKHWPDTLKRWPLTESFPLYQPSNEAMPSPNGSSIDRDTEDVNQSENLD